MAIFDIFTKKKKPNAWDGKWTQQFLQFGGVTTNSDQNDDTYIKDGYRSNPTVNAIVGMTQKNAGMVKWGIYKKNADNTKEPYRDVMLENLFQQPNNLMSWNEMVQQLIGFKMLTGNAYLWGLPGSASGRGVKSLYVLPSQEVQIHVADNQRSIQGYSLEFYGLNDDELIPYEQVLHLRTFNPKYNEGNNFLYGQSPLKAAYTSLKTNNDALNTSRNYLLNQGPPMFIELETGDTFDALTEEQMNEINKKMKKKYGGTGKAGNIPILPGGYKVHTLGSPAADLKLIEHYDLTVNDICNVYNFPTLLLGSGESTFSNQKEAKKALWSNVIIPILTEIRDGLNNWLAPMYGDDICIDFDIRDIKELQEDIEAQANAISKLQGIVTVNEARAKIGLAPLAGPEGDELYIFTQTVKDDAEQTDSNDQQGG